jgi:hypothetical protein
MQARNYLPPVMSRIVLSVAIMMLYCWKLVAASLNF